jgi:hypothetical protein
VSGGADIPVCHIRRDSPGRHESVVPNFSIERRKAFLHARLSSRNPLASRRKPCVE